jgi:hypothetical protein
MTSDLIRAANESAYSISKDTMTSDLTEAANESAYSSSKDIP